MSSVIDLINVCAANVCGFHCYENSLFCSEHNALGFKTTPNDLLETTVLANIVGIAPEARFFTGLEVTLLERHIGRISVDVPENWIGNNMVPLASAIELDSTPMVFLLVDQATILLRAVHGNDRLSKTAKLAFDRVICACVLCIWELKEGKWYTCWGDIPQSKSALVRVIYDRVALRNSLVL